MVIIGIDPGLVNTGWGIIESVDNKINFIGCGTIITKNNLSIANRIVIIHSQITQVLTTYNPTEGGIEEVFISKYAQACLKLGHARGALILSLSLAKVNLAEYAATLVKKSIVGLGHAQKNQVSVMVKYLLPNAKMNNEHEADALAVAICHSLFIK